MVSGTRADQLIVIVGPTASGKSELAMRIARRYNGEIICADSRTVYKGLDIGTAKPSKADQAEIPHHLLDIIEPEKTFSAAEFQRLANSAIDDSKKRQKMPLLVGGSGLFIDGVLFNFHFLEKPSVQLRAQLEKKTNEELQEYCVSNNIELPENKYNKRHLIRTIERGGANKERGPLRRDAFIVGIRVEKEELQQRIHLRSNRVFAAGVVNEATYLASKFSWSAAGLSGNIYPIAKELVEGKISEPEAIKRNSMADWQLARRQLAWFKRNPYIEWVDSIDKGEQLIATHLAKLQ